MAAVKNLGPDGGSAKCVALSIAQLIGRRNRCHARIRSILPWTSSRQISDAAANYLNWKSSRGWQYFPTARVLTHTTKSLYRSKKRVTANLGGILQFLRCEVNDAKTHCFQAFSVAWA